MLHRLLTAAALCLATTTGIHAQPASAPPAATAPATPAPAAAATSKASATAGVDEGKIAFYGRKFAGRRTASGERFNPAALTMAHRSLPFGSLVRVTNLKNRRSVVLRVNDRGPTTADRVGDVSLAAAQRLGFRRSGVVMVKLEVVGQAKPRGHRMGRHPR